MQTFGAWNLVYFLNKRFFPFHVYLAKQSILLNNGSSYKSVISKVIIILFSLECVPLLGIDLSIFNLSELCLKCNQTVAKLMDHLNWQIIKYFSWATWTGKFSSLSLKRCLVPERQNRNICKWNNKNAL